ncbi:MAG: serine hydrolase domain-containing protein [Bacteroidota bacterium]
MNAKILLLLLLLFIEKSVSAQLNQTQYQKIDSLFLAWNSPNHPGGVVGIMKNDEIIFQKAYGLASLEFLVPNTTSTLFNTASVSKQFTAMGIVLLDIEGKLSVDDNIKKYIPELPDFEESITIRHLLHHTSGLRSLHALLELAGWRDDDTRTNADLYRIMANQRDLNFTPGDEYLYCNTGFMYMAKIIETVTSEKFTDWMKKSVFEPLGMIDTYVEDIYNRVVPQNATSYYGSQKRGFKRAVEYWGYVGSGNMHATVGDLLKWMANFYKPQSGWEAHFKMLQTLDKFNNGEENTYAFGVGIGDFNGIKSVGHGGAIGGFRSNVISFPEEALSIVILTNFSSASPGQKSRAIAEVILGETKDKAMDMLPGALKPIKISKEALKKYEGTYWNDKSNFVQKVYFNNDTLRYIRADDSENSLIPTGENEFQILGTSKDIKVTFGLGKNKTMTITVDGPSPITSYSFEPIASTKDELAAYTGKFYSPELETSYTISLKNDTLFWHHIRHGDFKMKRIKKDVLKGNWPFNMVKFQRNKKGKVTGILVSNGRVRNLWLEKQG